LDISHLGADDWGVIAITDANFGVYQITADELKRAMNRDPKVFAALICIGESAETPWYALLEFYFGLILITNGDRITKSFPGRASRVANTADIPRVLKSIFSTMVER